MGLVGGFAVVALKSHSEFSPESKLKRVVLLNRTANAHVLLLRSIFWLKSRGAHYAQDRTSPKGPASELEQFLAVHRYGRKQVDPVADVALHCSTSQQAV